MFVFTSYSNHSFLFYDLIEKLHEEEKISPWVYEILTKVNDFFIKVFNKVKEKLLTHRIIRISRRDLYSLDHSLSHIILEGLVRFKKDNNFSIPFVDDEDVPQDMRYESHNTEAIEANNELLEQRWEYVLDQMIEAFVILSEDTWNYQTDEEIVNQGLKMFGKYYRNLWI